MNRRRGALTLVVAAVLGGAVTSGILAVTGTFGTGAASSGAVIQQAAASGTSAASTSSGDVSGLYADASPGVVQITSKGSSQSSGSGPLPQSGQSEATGTGFVIDEQGDILTAAHVVDGGSSITVTFQDGTTRTASVSGKDDATDAAVIKVDPSGLDLHPLKLGDSGSLQVGDELAAIGTPFGYSESLSTGVASGLDRTIQAPNGFTVAHAIQTDAALNPGNSGGPVLNSDGDVIGIADQIATNGGGDSFTGVGFAVPIDLVKSELSQLEAGQSVEHAFLGVSTGNSQSGTPGALVGSVASGSPAADAGLHTGDVVTAVDGTQITSGDGLVAEIAGHKPGDKITLTVHRNSQTSTVDVTLGTQPSQAGQ
ncbi:MAG TPA: trypsin-like peptidase domain-containing protein [Solirubrobacterales bacterium]|nr:trypsin-like peptidase domain-containing protein [Solirubrobacterales bacterium]